MEVHNELSNLYKYQTINKPPYFPKPLCFFISLSSHPTTPFPYLLLCHLLCFVLRYLSSRPSARCQRPTIPYRSRHPPPPATADLRPLVLPPGNTAGLPPFDCPVLPTVPPSLNADDAHRHRFVASRRCPTDSHNPSLLSPS